MFFWFLTQPETFSILAILLAFVAAFTATPLFTLEPGAARVVVVRVVEIIAVLSILVAVFAVGLWFRWWWL